MISLSLSLSPTIVKVAINSVLDLCVERASTRSTKIVTDVTYGSLQRGADDVVLVPVWRLNLEVPSDNLGER
jgi:hypothetical protein